MNNSKEFYFLQRETKSKENDIYIYIMNMEIAANFEAVKFTRTQS